MYNYYGDFMKLYGLFFTLILGLFIIFGAFIVQLFKNKDKFILISLSMAFGVMMTLIVLELFPEAYEIFSIKYNLYVAITLIIVIGVLGYFLLKILDRFIPDHEKEDESNLMHIGIVSSIAIIIHNIIEGMAIYSTINSSLTLGLMLSIGVGLHNIPLGMAISSAFYDSIENKRKSNIIILLISLSTFVGGLIMFLFSGMFVNEFIIGIILSVTIGMLVYINISEILPRLIESKDKKTVVISTVLGIIILIVSTLFG